MNRIIVLLLLGACSSGSSDNDPMKNSKKFFAGHVSLYKNGALEVPLTTVQLIPPGPKMVELSSMLIGVKAKDSLRMSLGNAMSSYNIVTYGTLKGLSIGKKVYSTTTALSSDIHESVSSDSLYLIQKSVALPADAARVSWALSKEWITDMQRVADSIQETAKTNAHMSKEEILEGGRLTSESIERSRIAFQEEWSRDADAFDARLQRKGQRADTEAQHEANETYADTLKRAHDHVDRSKDHAEDIREKTSLAAHESGESVSSEGDRAASALKSSAKDVNVRSQKSASSSLSWGMSQFVQGYISLPHALKTHSSDVAKTLPEFTRRFKESDAFREHLSQKTTVMMGETLKTYGEDAQSSWEKAGQELETNSSSIGYTLGTIKALGWLSKALLWDSIIKPSGKLTAAGLGYISVNMVAFPALLAYDGAVSSTQLAVQTMWSTTKASYDLMAPTALAAVASVFSVLSYTGGKIAAGGLNLASEPTRYAIRGTGKIVEGSVKAAGKSAELAVKAQAGLVHGGAHVVAPLQYAHYRAQGKTTKAGINVAAKTGKWAMKGAGHSVRVAGKGGEVIVQGVTWPAAQMVEVATRGVGEGTHASMTYIGVPLVAAGVPIVGTTVGATVGALGATGAGSYFAAGESAAAGTYVFGTVLSGGTVAAGVVGGTAVGASVAAYEIAKSIAVPSTYTLGSGIVLTYGHLVHLGAHSILAASNVSYLVLSLEGPRWVIYGVTGRLNDGSNLAGGTVLDLEKMKKAGETFEYIPVSKEEMNEVVRSVGEHRN